MSGNIGDTNPSYLGGGVPGVQLTLIGGGANQNSGSGMVGGSDRSMDRVFLRKTAGKYMFLQTAGILPAGFKSGLTPFRQLFVAGDISMASSNYSGTTTNSSLPVINQVNSIGVSTLNAN